MFLQSRNNCGITIRNLILHILGDKNPDAVKEQYEILDPISIVPKWVRIVEGDLGRIPLLGRRFLFHGSPQLQKPTCLVRSVKRDIEVPEVFARVAGAPHALRFL
jgi:hypothetical protein